MTQYILQLYICHLTGLVPKKSMNCAYFRFLSTVYSPFSLHFRLLSDRFPFFICHCKDKCLKSVAKQVKEKSPEKKFLLIFCKFPRFRKKEKFLHFGLMCIDQVNKYTSIYILSSLYSFYHLPFLMEPISCHFTHFWNNPKQHIVRAMQRNISLIRNHFFYIIMIELW